MSPSDHNKTLVIIYLLLGGFFTLPLIISPWIIAKNIDQYPSPRRSEQILIGILIAAAVITLASLFLVNGAWSLQEEVLGQETSAHLVCSVLSTVPAYCRLHLVVHAQRR